MAAEFLNEPEGLVRTAGLVAPTSDYTACWWSQVGTLPGAGDFDTEFYYGDNPATLYTDYIRARMNQTGQVNIEIAGVPSAFYTLSQGTHHWAYTRTGNVHRLYIDGVQRISLTQSIAAFPAPTHQYLGTDTFNAGWHTHRAKDFREWNSALTAVEITAERASPAAVRTANLITDTPLLNDLLDDSGNGNDWAEAGGTITFTQDPLNTSAATAIDLVSLPATRADDAHNGGTTFTLWYKYKALPTELVIGGFGFGDLTVYQPIAETFTGPVTAPTPYLFIFAPNVPFQMPVVANTTYFFSFTSNFGNPSPAILLLDFLTASKEVISVGSLLIPDDTQGFPLAVVSTNPGDVKNFVSPFPNGEGAATLDNGYALYEDFGNNQLKTYDGDFNLDKTLNIGNGFVRINGNATQGTFLAANQTNPVTVFQIDGTGTQTNSFSLTPTNDILSLTSDLAEIVMYWARAIAGADIHAWNMKFGFAEPDLASGIVGHFISDMWTLKDGTIIASFVRQSTDTFLVKRYNTGGTLLNTYNLGSPNFPAGTFPRIVPGTDDPNSFWGWSHNDDGTSTFRNVKVSDGTILDTVIAVEYEGGIYQGIVTAVPAKRFGISFSCPVTIKHPPAVTEDNDDGTVFVGTPSTVAGGLYQIVPGKTDDSLWDTFSPPTSIDVKIP